MHDDDLDELVSELNRGAPLAERSRVTAADTTTIESWLAVVRHRDASDLLLVAGTPPTMRAAGKLVRITQDVLTSDEIEAAVIPLVTQRLQERYRDGEAIDLAFKLAGRGRFRMNLHRERGRTAATIRALPTKIPRLTDLRFTHDI